MTIDMSLALLADKMPIHLLADWADTGWVFGSTT